MGTETLARGVAEVFGGWRKRRRDKVISVSCVCAISTLLSAGHHSPDVFSSQHV